MTQDQPRVRALVVDDATVIRESMPALMPGIDFVGQYSRVETLLEDRPVADVVVLDLHLVNSTQPSARQGVAAVRMLVDAGYRVCVYSQEERRFVLAAGATGIVSKSAPTAEAQEAFVDAAAGRVVVPQAIIGLIEVLVRRKSLTILSQRQRQVLAGRARGLTYAELSTQLYLSESTLRGYWRDLTTNVSTHLQQTTPAEIERALGLGPGDLLEFWPESPARPR
ncbi:DNA-binding response regulator [Janibacter melonis]|uniref:DNA-binding response regulator n=1 Tax=Janibacter melonis TaxID=262209 RepID=UPI0020433909|nr:DNA-binding response regulator [Janibacter melonis]MCM3555611.1 DNA-binding response regulator [Janibacter melonis]